MLHSSEQGLKEIAMVSKKLLGSVAVAMALPTLLMAVSGGVANASNVNSTIETYPGCKWELSSVPNQVNMAPVDFDTLAPLPADTKYVGDKLWLAGIWSGMTLALTGNDAPGTGINNQMTDCSFYNEAALKFPMVKASLNQAKTDWMNAHYLDPQGNEQVDEIVSFQIKPDTVTDGGEGNALGISPYSPGLVALALGSPSPAPTANDLQCIDSRIGAAKSINRGLDVNYPSHSYTNKMILWVTDVEDKYEATEAPRCSLDTLFMLFIPGINEVPESPGSNYVFKGPEVIFTLTTQATVPATPANPVQADGSPTNTNYMAYTVASMLGE
jgi:hypothetical protein